MESQSVNSVDPLKKNKKLNIKIFKLEGKKEREKKTLRRIKTEYVSSLILCLCPQLIRLLLLCVLRHVRVILHAKFPGHLREEAMLPQHLREQGGTISPLTDFVSKDEHRASLHGAHQHVPGDKTGRAGGGQLIRPPRPVPI